MALLAQSLVWLWDDDEDSTRKAYLIVSDREDLPETTAFARDEIFEKNPEILRNCGIEEFSIWASNGMPHVGVTSGFVLSEQSDDALNCVLESIADHEVYGLVRSSDHPQALSPIVQDFERIRAAEKNAQTH
ncbi:hypothetical protein [Qipengyuania sp.]|uniref:hypothetical protein n=1 Tax=Qipengyuania sp. TaxID=2004515 RepID=UPI003512EC0C